MTTNFSLLLACLLVYSMITACGHKGPPLAPKEKPLTLTGFQDLPANLAITFHLKINISI